MGLGGRTWWLGAKSQSLYMRRREICLYAVYVRDQRDRHLQSGIRVPLSSS